MFPFGGNRPRPPNMMGQQMGFPQPSRQVRPGIMPSVPTQSRPFRPGISPNMPAQSSHIRSQGVGSQGHSFYQGNKTLQTTQFPSSNTTIRQKFQNRGTGIATPQQGQGSFGSTVSNPANRDQSSLGKNKLTQVTVDFIKQFQKQVAKKKAEEERRNRMKVQSKASQHRETSPFSDDSDPGKAMLAPTDKVRTTAAGKPNESTPLKSILKSTKPTQQLGTKTQVEQVSTSKTSTAVFGRMQDPLISQPTKTSSGLNSILKNYDTETKPSARIEKPKERTTEPKGQLIPTLIGKDERRPKRRRDSKMVEKPVKVLCIHFIVSVLEILI